MPESKGPPRPLMCPLLAQGNSQLAQGIPWQEYQGAWSCLGKQCAWWIEEYQADMSDCAIVRIAMMLGTRKAGP